MLIEFINDYQITKDKVYFIGYNKQPELEKFINKNSKKKIVNKDTILKSNKIFFVASNLDISNSGKINR